jgi:uncharacterized protein (TIGR00369 family)
VVDAEAHGPDDAEWVGGDWQRDAAPGGIALCGACRRTGRCRLGLLTESLGEDGTVTTSLVCDESNEGGPGVAHGGWTAGALDEIVGHVVLMHRRMAVTGELTVRFLRPVPICRPLRATARRVKQEGDRWFVTAELVLAATGAVLATAEAVMVERDRTHFARFQHWLESQDAAG